MNLVGAPDVRGEFNASQIVGSTDAAEVAHVLVEGGATVLFGPLVASHVVAREGLVPLGAVLLLGHELLHVLHHSAHILRVLDDGAQLLLPKVRGDLLAQQYLGNHVA